MGAYMPSMGLEPVYGHWTVTKQHCQRDARPTVTFSATEFQCPVTATKLYCLLSEACVCEQLAQGCYYEAERPGFEAVTCEL